MMTKAQNTNSALLSLLVCPVSLSDLIYDKGRQNSSFSFTFAFPIQDGVPIMMIEAARLISDNDVRRLRMAPVQLGNDTSKK